MIRLLPDPLVNQIAAGEVVDRPASVVKELVENSLDAGARQVLIDIEQGGSRLLRVRDDGAGIAHDQLALALTRHATSKIGTLDDLLRVASLGFRGEALPSIASVSRFSLTSRTAGAEHGWQLRLSTGRFGEPVPAAHPPGTTVQVRELFFNIPARRSSCAASAPNSATSMTCPTLALAHPQVEFCLTQRARAAPLPPGSGAFDPARMEQLLTVISETALPCGSVAGLRLTGLVGAPATRSRADLQYFFVNGRPVRDRVVGHAVRQAHADVLHHGRHPAYVLP